FPVPGLITDLVLSMDDKFLYFSDWLHGDLRQYDVSDPANPKLTGQLWLGGLLGKPNDAGRELNGGPQMLQLSFDGRHLYVTNSLYSTWDNQFYPELRSWLLRVNCNPNGGMDVDRDFFVDLSTRPDDPARAIAPRSCSSARPVRPRQRSARAKMISESTVISGSARSIPWRSKSSSSLTMIPLWIPTTAPWRIGWLFASMLGWPLV